jgi:hypothetical protein
MDNQNIQKFKEFAQEAIEYDDVSMAVKLLTILKRETSLTPELEELKTKLQFIRFPSLPTEVALDLLRYSFTAALEIPYYDIVAEVGKKIAFIAYAPEQVTFIQNVYNIFGKNEEMIGPKPIKDWVKEYYDFRASAAKRSTLDEINYINQSPNTKTLKEEQKAMLLVILKITDSAMNALREIQSPVGDAKAADLPADYDYSVLVPGLVRPEDLQKSPDLNKILGIKPEESSAQVTTSVSQPRASEPSLPPQPAPVSEAPTTSAPQPASLKTAPKPVIPPTLSKRPVPGASVNVQDVLNRRNQQQGRGGVVFDEQTNIKVEEMSQRIEAERQQKQTEIDKKLQALKKRKPV